MAFRVERDPLGEVRVPDGALYGAQTQRALDNFPISGLRAFPELVRATVLIKRAGARANKALGRLDGRLAGAVIRAADEILAGQHLDHFAVDVYQAGAGTSHNMNTNEVLANLAEERLGGSRGRYERVHPNDHVNMGQSTNDVFPTATRLALLLALPGLVRAGEGLATSLEQKRDEFAHVLKTGRTHLQDAVPITLGQEFGGYAANLRHAPASPRSSCRRCSRGHRSCRAK
jgi:aspartate ammonia-lyase